MSRSRLHRSTRGLTLLEVLVVMAILLLVVGVGVTGVTRMKSVRLRSETNRLAAAIRHCYNRASAHGLYLRMEIDLDSESYSVKASDRPIFLARAKRQHGDDGVDPEDLDTDDRDIDSDEEALTKARARRAKYTEDGVISKITFKGGVGIDGVYTSGQDDVFESGTAYIHFFPQGFVEPALIYTTDGEDLFYTLEISPLTGKVNRQPGKIDPDRKFGQPDRIEEEYR